MSQNMVKITSKQLIGTGKYPVRKREIRHFNIYPVLYIPATVLSRKKARAVPTMTGFPISIDNVLSTSSFPGNMHLNPTKSYTVNSRYLEVVGTFFYKFK